MRLDLYGRHRLIGEGDPGWDFLSWARRQLPHAGIVGWHNRELKVWGFGFWADKDRCEVKECVILEDPRYPSPRDASELLAQGSEYRFEWYRRWYIHHKGLQRDALRKKDDELKAARDRTRSFARREGYDPNDPALIGLF